MHIKPTAECQISTLIFEKKMGQALGVDRKVEGQALGVDRRVGQMKAESGGASFRSGPESGDKLKGMWGIFEP
jgi:hypothetical protein